MSPNSQILRVAADTFSELPRARQKTQRRHRQEPSPCVSPSTRSDSVRSQMESSKSVSSAERRLSRGPSSDEVSNVSEFMINADSVFQVISRSTAVGYTCVLSSRSIMESSRMHLVGVQVSKACD